MLYLFMDGTCVVRDPKGQQIACIARLPSGLYQVQRNVKSAHAKQVMSLDEFHRRMGHLRMDATKVLVQKGMIMGIELDDSPSDSNCASCVEAKMTHVPFPKQHSSPRQLPTDSWSILISAVLSLPRQLLASSTLHCSWTIIRQS